MGNPTFRFIRFAVNRKQNCGIFACLYDQRGGVVIFVALSMIAFFALAGVATDSGRGYLLQARLSHALDAAGLAGGRIMLLPERDDDIRTYFNANFPPNYLGSSVEGPFIEADEDKESLTLTARATIRTTFMQFLGIPTTTVSARTVIRRSSRGLELVMVLDNTGSMCQPGPCSKIEALKTAATDLVNILYGDDEQPPGLWVGMVPFVTTVNIGNAHTDWLVRDPDPLNPTFDRTQPLTAYHQDFYLPATWQGCVEARRAPYDQDDTTTATKRFVPYFYPETRVRVGPREIDNPWPAVTAKAGPNLNCPNPLTPLGSAKQTLLDDIDAMTTARGGTHMTVGMSWGWRMISPAWRGLWDAPTPVDHPVDYDTPLVEKAAILLTDGVNNIVPRNLGGVSSSVYTAYGRLDWGRLGTTSERAAEATLDTRLANTCQLMKNEGVIIYTIVFATTDPDVLDLLEECATTPSHFFSAPTNKELQTVFKTIANDLSDLRIAE